MIRQSKITMHRTELLWRSALDNRQDGTSTSQANWFGSGFIYILGTDRTQNNTILWIVPIRLYDIFRDLPTEKNCARFREDQVCHLICNSINPYWELLNILVYIILVRYLRASFFVPAKTSTIGSISKWGLLRKQKKKNPDLQSFQEISSFQALHYRTKGLKLRG